MSHYKKKVYFNTCSLKKSLYQENEHEHEHE